MGDRVAARAVRQCASAKVARDTGCAALAQPSAAPAQWVAPVRDLRVDFLGFWVYITSSLLPSQSLVIAARHRAKSKRRDLARPGVSFYLRRRSDLRLRYSKRMRVCWALD